MKPCQHLTFLRTIFLLFTAAVTTVTAQDGYYQVTQLPIANAMGPSINNSGEIVWAVNGDGGIFSSVRGKLADSGIFPHLANSGEVVYADRVYTIFVECRDASGNASFKSTTVKVAPDNKARHWNWNHRRNFRD